MKVKIKQNYIISSLESQRIQILKIWLTIMVLFIHIYSNLYSNHAVLLNIPLWLEFIISQVVCRSAVPGYFFISGILLYRKDFTWAENIKKKISTLVIPYLFINSLWLIIFFITQNIPSLSSFFSNENNNISNWGIGDYLNAFIGYKNSCPLVYPLWFIRDLFILNIVAILFKCIIDKYPKITLIVLLIIGMFDLQIPIFFLQHSSIVFFFFGYYFVKYSIHLSVVDKINKSVVILVYITLIIIDFLTRDLFVNNPIHFLTILSGLSFFYSQTTIIANNKMNNRLLFIANYSFSIYLFHEMSMTIIKKILNKILPQSLFWQMIQFFIIPIIVFCLCLVMSIVLDKYLHKFYSILVGKRCAPVCSRTQTEKNSRH